MYGSHFGPQWGLAGLAKVPESLTITDGPGWLQRKILEPRPRFPLPPPRAHLAQAARADEACSPSRGPALLVASSYRRRLPRETLEYAPKYLTR